MTKNFNCFSWLSENALNDTYCMDGDVRILSSPTTCFLLYIYQKYVQRFVLETFSLIVICLLIYTKEKNKEKDWLICWNQKVKIYGKCPTGIQIVTVLVLFIKLWTLILFIWNQSIIHSQCYLCILSLLSYDQLLNLSLLCFLPLDTTTSIGNNKN